MAPELVLSVLDQCPVPAGCSASETLAATLDLARTTERLGYQRYWLAEHHNTDSLAGVSPEVLVAAVAARTSRIRVGSGGVLLPHYSPLKVAENFRLLDALHPGRIDLGVGRAAGTDPVAEAALQYRPGALGDEHFGQKLVDLLGFLDGALGDDHPFAGARAFPAGNSNGPDVWVLGSSSNGAGAAAYLGLPFAFAHFITAEFGPQIVRSYRKGFTPSARLAEPRAVLAVAAVCAETDAEAHRLATSAAAWRLRPEGAARGPLLPPEEAAGRIRTDMDRAQAEQARAGMVVGAPERVRVRLVELANEFGVDEIMVVTVCHDLAARRRSYELLAEAFGLG
ncbi:MAG TPA: LLM class flavin-dependent oxidoreductase [Acidimicrobiales bacterium]